MADRVGASINGDWSVSEADYNLATHPWPLQLFRVIEPPILGKRGGLIEYGL
jgi:hypothetical protein